MTAINTAEDRAAIYERLREIGNSLTQIRDQRDHIKEVIEALAEQFPDISKKQFRKAAKFLHEQTFETECADFEELEILYKTIVGGTNV